VCGRARTRSVCRGRRRGLPLLSPLSQARRRRAGPRHHLSAGEESTLARLDLSEAEADPGFAKVASTWSIDDDRLEPGVSARGPRIVDFAPVLKYDAFPFAAVVDAVLEVCAKSMGIPVEIEYAVSEHAQDGSPVFYLLQIKPLIQRSDKVSVDLGALVKGECLVSSDHCMGNGRVHGIHDIIFVDPSTWDRSATEAIAIEIAGLNEALKAEGRHFALIGPGRWGTRDRWLGVPVSFAQISNAKAIVEADLPDFRVDSSLGSHFFHNVTAMNIGYFSAAYGSDSSFVDWTALAGLPVHARTAHCVHVRVEEAVDVSMDGRLGHGVIRIPAIRLTTDEKSDTIEGT